MEIRTVTLLLDDMGGGGAARVAAHLSGAWAEMGRKVTILTGDDGQRPPHYPLHPSVAHLSLAWHATSRSLLDGFWANLRRLARLRRAIRGLQPDLVVSFLDTINVRCLLATLGLGIPVLISERTDPHGRSLGLAWETLRLVTYSWSGALVVQSRHALSYFPPRLRAKGLVIPNPVPPAPAAGAPSRRADRFSVATLGSLRSVKGHDQLIEAFALLADQFPSWDLWIHGEGPARDRLEAQVRCLHLEARVHLPGSTDQSTARLREADLFVLPSRTEGFPNALAEAMACGLPVISFDCASGPRELIRPEVDGMLVPAGDIPGLAVAMARLMADPAERERMAARAPEVVERFSTDKILDLWERAIQLAAWSR
jgi:glycosyltransferase involved in cell wall biosynthesis